MKSRRRISASGKFTQYDSTRDRLTLNAREREMTDVSAAGFPFNGRGGSGDCHAGRGANAFGGRDHRNARRPLATGLLARMASNADGARIERANRTAADLAPVIAELRTAGVTSLKAIAKALDDRHLPTPAGSLHWHPMQVARVLKRLAG
jgi:hypothetical protein